MKLLAIVGTNADFSYNRCLDQFMAKRYKDQAEIEVYEIADLPRFKKEAQPDSKVEEFKNKIREADGVIFATPEYDHGIPSALKSAMEDPELLENAEKQGIAVTPIYGEEFAVWAETQEKNIKSIYDMLDD